MYFFNFSKNFFNAFKKSFSQFFIAKENFIGEKKESDPFNPKKA